MQGLSTNTFSWKKISLFQKGLTDHLDKSSLVDHMTRVKFGERNIFEKMSNVKYSQINSTKIFSEIHFRSRNSYHAQYDCSLLLMSSCLTCVKN